MFTLSSYNLIERKLIINNPFEFFCELKYRSNDVVFANLKRSMNFNEYSLLYELVLHMASEERFEWQDLIENKDGIEIDHYLTTLDQCLQTLTKGEYIRCKHRTRIDSKKDVTELKIVELNICDKGLEVLKTIEKMKTIHIDRILMKCVENLSAYVAELDVLNISRDDLISEYKEIYSNVSDLCLIEFDHQVSQGLTLNYYAGQFEVDDVDDLKAFINLYNNFEIEKMVTIFFNRSVKEIYDLKVIIQVLDANRFDSVYGFMTESDLLRHLSYLTNMEFIKMDYSYGDIYNHPFSYDIKIHKYSVTDLGYDYLKNKTLIKMKESVFIAPEVVKTIQSGVRRQDYKKFFMENSYSNELIVFKDIEDDL